MQPVRIGTRGSDLALWQANHVGSLLRAQYPGIGVEIRVIKTTGDRALNQPLAEIGSKGLFTAEIEAALHSGEIDCAVHSLKDLPVEDTPGLMIGAVPERAPVPDVLVSRDGHTLAALPSGAVVGTGSKRRAAQLLHHRPGLKIEGIRGNVPTRIDRALAKDGPYDAIILAQAGVERLELSQHISEILPLSVMLNAPGQGALAIQCRADEVSRSFFAPLQHKNSWLSVTAERAFLQALGGGCSIPVAAYGCVQENTLKLQGRVSAHDGARQVDVEHQVKITPESDQQVAVEAGTNLAKKALEKGAKALLEGAEA